MNAQLSLTFPLQIRKKASGGTGDMCLLTVQKKKLSGISLRGALVSNDCYNLTEEFFFKIKLKKTKHQQQRGQCCQAIISKPLQSSSELHAKEKFNGHAAASCIISTSISF